MRQLLSVLALAGCLAASAVAADLPRPAPELIISLPANRSVKMSDYKNKVRILTFILTT